MESPFMLSAQAPTVSSTDSNQVKTSCPVLVVEITLGNSAVFRLPLGLAVGQQPLVSVTIPSPAAVPDTRPT